MTRHGGSQAVRCLIACVAVLLAAGGWSAATLAGGASTTVVAGGRADAAAVGGAAPLEDRVSPPTVVTTAVTTPATTVVPPWPTTTAVGPAPTTSAAPRRTATTSPPTTATPPNTPLPLVPGLPLPGRPPIPILNPPASSWSSTSGTVTSTMRMEPATPVPGQPVKFYISVVAGNACCMMNISYGDGVVSPNPPGDCDSPTTRSATLTHTFTAPGNYELFFIVGTFPCTLTVVDGQIVAPPIYGTGIKACITVGLAPAVQPSCTPYNHFGPGTVYSAA